MTIQLSNYLRLKATLSSIKPIYKNKTVHDKTRTQGNNGNNSKRKLVVTRDSMLNGINKRGLSKHQNVKIQHFPGGTTKTILDIDYTLHNYTCWNE